LAKRGKDFFRSADIKLNREIKSERDRLAKARPREGAFIKQLKADQAGKNLSKSVEAAQAFQPFEGKQQVPPKENIKANFEVDPAKTEANEPNKGFSFQISHNAGKNGVK